MSAETGSDDPMTEIDREAERLDPGHLLRVNEELRRELAEARANFVHAHDVAERFKAEIDHLNVCQAGMAEALAEMQALEEAVMEKDRIARLRRKQAEVGASAAVSSKIFEELLAAEEKVQECIAARRVARRARDARETPNG